MERCDKVSSDARKPKRKLPVSDALIKSWMAQEIKRNLHILVNDLAMKAKIKFDLKGKTCPRWLIDMAMDEVKFYRKV
jgi:hypothetical protein